MKQLNEQKCLQLISAICLAYQNSEKSLKNAENMLDDIYKVAHGYSKTSCWNVHKDWRLESVKWYREYKKIGFI